MVNRWLVACALLLGPCAAQADILCRMVSLAGIAFGPYETMSPVATDTVGSVLVTCERNGGPQNVVLTMRLGPGQNSSTTSARRMRQQGGADYLSYGLYRDNARSAVWGNNDSVDTVSQSITIAISNKGTQSATFTIYGRIPPLQDVTAGTFADTVDITLTP